MTELSPSSFSLKAKDELKKTTVSEGVILLDCELSEIVGAIDCAGSGELGREISLPLRQVGSKAYFEDGVIHSSDWDREEILRLHVDSIRFLANEIVLDGHHNYTVTHGPYIESWRHELYSIVINISSKGVNITKKGVEDGRYGSSKPFRDERLWRRGRGRF